MEVEVVRVRVEEDFADGDGVVEVELGVGVVGSEIEVDIELVEGGRAEDPAGSFEDDLEAELQMGNAARLDDRCILAVVGW